jgi:hypothetical protein
VRESIIASRSATADSGITPAATLTNPYSTPAAEAASPTST